MLDSSLIASPLLTVRIGLRTCGAAEHLTVSKLLGNCLLALNDWPCSIHNPLNMTSPSFSLLFGQLDAEWIEQPGERTPLSAASVIGSLSGGWSI